MSLHDEVSHGVLIPINLIRQTIAYLDSYNDPMAVLLRQHYKSWLKMSIQQVNHQKVHRVLAAQASDVDSSPK